VILWLVKQDDRNRDDVWIKLDQRRFNPGSRVHVEAGARTAAGDAIANARLETALVHPGGRREVLTLARDNEVFRGTVEPMAAGDYAIEMVAFEGEKRLGAAKAEFLVFDRDVELSTPAADPDLMASLAAWTRHEGGRAVAPEELPALLSELASRPPEYEVRQTRWKLAGTSGDAWAMFLCMACCLSLEWFLRKRWGLV
jgi:acyl transferase domain-containing protein